MKRCVNPFIGASLMCSERMKMDCRHLLAMVSLVTVLGAAQTQAEMFTNGDFESPTFTPTLSNTNSYGYSFTGANIVQPTGWTLNQSGASCVFLGEGPKWGVAGSNPYAVGNQYLYFNDSTNVAGGTAYQTFDTVAGLTYEVSFQVGHIFAVGGVIASNLATVRSDVFDGSATSGTPLGSLSDSRYTIGVNAAATFQFTAESTSSTIVFTDVSTGNLSKFDTGLDNVSITLVPEPGMMMLCVTAAIGLICYAWRRRK